MHLSLEKLHRDQVHKSKTVYPIDFGNCQRRCSAGRVRNASRLPRDAREAAATLGHLGRGWQRQAGEDQRVLARAVVHEEILRAQAEPQLAVSTTADPWFGAHWLAIDCSRSRRRTSAPPHARSGHARATPQDTI